MKKKDKQILTGLAIATGLVFLVKRLSAKQPPTGEVFIGPVTVTPTKYTDEDARQTQLTALQKKAFEWLAVDLDEMTPRRRPTQNESLVLQSIIAELARAGRDSDARFIAQLAKDAEHLPVGTV